MPCTNCQAFGFECKIPTAGRKKKGSKQQQQQPEDAKDSASRDGTKEASGSPAHERHGTPSVTHDGKDLTRPSVTRDVNGAPVPERADPTKLYVDFIDHDIAQQAIPDNGRVAFLGESSNLSFIVKRRAMRDADKEIYHYPIPDVFRDEPATKLNVLDADEVEALKTRGAFLLPPRDVCDDLVETYFSKIAPQIPVVNKTHFMAQYHNATDPPPLLLLQVIFLAASRVSKNPALVDKQTGTTNNASMTFWKRAKALYDADYEDDKVVVIQALLLLSWWWEGPEDVTRNVWYWIGTAIRVAQGIGMHRSVAKSKMSLLQKRTWRRIWWTCFAQDRRVAASLGRPMCINVEDSDMEMLTEEDFIEEEVGPGQPLRYPPNRNHVLYFIQSVKLTEIMGVVLSRQYSAASRKAMQLQSLDLTHSDMALANWLMSLPPEMQYHCTKNASKQNFWAAFLHMTYYTVLCLLHRPHMKSSVRPDAAPTTYPSRNIAFTAANMITRILEDVVHYGNLEILPSFSTYAIFSAMIFHSFEIRSQNPVVRDAAHRKLQFCSKSLRDLSKVWLVASSIVVLFEAIGESKVLQDRLQKSALQAASSTNLTQTALETRKKRAMEAISDSRNLANLRAASNLGSPESTFASPTTALKRNADTMLGGTYAQSSRQDVSPALHQQAQAGMQSQPNHLSGASTPPDFFFSTQQSIPHTFFESYQPMDLFPQEALGLKQQMQQQKQQQQQQQMQQSASPSAMPAPASLPQQQQALTIPQAGSSGANSERQSPLSTGIGGDYWNPVPFANQGDLDFDAMAQGEGLHYPESTASDEGSRLGAPESLNIHDWYSFLGLV